MTAPNNNNNNTAIPTLHVYGSHDAIIAPEQSQALAAAIQGRFGELGFPLGLNLPHLGFTHGFDLPALLEFLSADTTLPGGSVILTGTPQGVGMARQPPIWLQPGDRVAVEIEGIGVLENPVVEGDSGGEPSATGADTFLHRT
jgi:hypothetical protein